MPDEIKVTKSWRDGCVGVRAKASASDMRGASVKAEVALELPIEAARRLIAELSVAVDAEEVKVAKKWAAEERRQAWHDREVAAGRMKLLSAAEFFKR